MTCIKHGQVIFFLHTNSSVKSTIQSKATDIIYFFRKKKIYPLIEHKKDKEDRKIKSPKSFKQENPAKCEPLPHPPSPQKNQTIKMVAICILLRRAYTFYSLIKIINIKLKYILSVNI